MASRFGSFAEAAKPTQINPTDAPYALAGICSKGIDRDRVRFRPAKP